MRMSSGYVALSQLHKLQSKTNQTLSISTNNYFVAVVQNFDVVLWYAAPNKGGI